MNAITRLCVGIVTATMLSAAVSAQTFRTFGAGQKTCGDLTLAKERRVADADLTYAMIIGWIDGYLTGASSEAAGSRMIWDLVLRDSDLTPPELVTARQRYCRDERPDDPVCSNWNLPPIRVADVYSVIRDAPLNARLAWVERECAAHPLERIKEAAGHFYLELAQVSASQTDARLPTAPTRTVLVGPEHFNTSIWGTTAVLTQMSDGMHLELVGPSPFGGTIIDMQLQGADWIGRSATAPSCNGEAKWRLQQVNQTRLVETTCVNGGRGVTFTLSKP